MPRLQALGVPIWVSVGGFSAEDFGDVCGMLDGHESVEVVELNLSCPNVEEAPETAAELVQAARAATTKPLYAKLSPATWDIADTARAVVAAGADGLSLVNTMRGLALAEDTLRPRLGTSVGGYSGPALLPIALACVHSCANAVDAPIVGMGGVTRGVDALALAAAGAHSVALGTILFADPGAPVRVRAELADETTARGIESVCRHPRRCARTRGRSIPVDSLGNAKRPANRAKRCRLTQGAILVDSCGSWSRRRRMPKPPPVRSTRGWRRSRGQTT